MITAKQLFERQTEEGYDRFLVENTLYDKDTKVAFVNDEVAIINAFTFNFLGILGSFNAARQLNDQTTLKFIQRYFKTDGQLRISNIDDKNHNISLVVKLMSDKQMFISPAKVAEMTRFLVLCKSGVINTIDDDIVRAWVSNIKNTAIMKADPKLRDVLLKFKNGAISMIDASKEMRRQRTKHDELSTEYWEVSKRIRFKNMDTVTGGTASGTDGDDDGAVAQKTDGDTDAVSSVADVPVVAPEPEPVVSSYLTYDHDDGMTKIIFEQIDAAMGLGRGICGLDTLALTDKTKESDFTPTGFEFDKSDEAQLEIYKKYEDQYAKIIKILAGTSYYIVEHNSINNDVTSFAAHEDQWFIKHRPHLRQRYQQYGAYGNDYPLKHSYSMYAFVAALITSENDLPNWIYGFTFEDLGRELFNNSTFLKNIIEDSAKIDYQQYGLLGDGLAVVSDERRILVIDGIPLPFISHTLTSMGVHDSINTVPFLSEDLFKGTKALATFQKAMESQVANLYPQLWHLEGWGEQGKLVKLYMTMLEYLRRDYFVGVNYSAISEYWDKISYLDDEDFSDKVRRILSTRSNPMVYLPLEKVPPMYTASLAKSMIRYSKIGDYVPKHAVSLAIKAFPETAPEIEKYIIEIMDSQAHANISMNLIACYIDGANTHAEVNARVKRLVEGAKTTYGKSRITRMISQTEPDNRTAFFMAAYEHLGAEMKPEEVGSFSYDFIVKIDFDETNAAKFMDLEVKNGFKFMNKENFKDISSRAAKQQAMQVLVDIMYDGMKTDPDITNVFFENMDDYYKTRVRNALTGIKFIYNQVTGGPINMFDTPNMKRVKQMFEFNEIDPDELVKAAKIRAKKGEKFTDYIARVETAAATSEVVPQPAVVDDGINDHQKFLIGEHLVSKYYAGKHGNTYPLIHKSFTVNLTYPEFNAFLAEQEAIGKLEQIVPCFHGTGGIAANMVLRYGFKIIPSKDSSVVGRMLGDGVYFSNKIDKILQYVGNSGYGRLAGTRGYVFEMESILGKPKTDYRSAGVPNATDKHAVRSPEWAVFDPKKQLKVLKCYEVELNTHSKFKEHQSKMKDEGLNERKFMKFDEVLTEAKRERVKDYIIYTFYDGKVPMIRNGSIEYVTAKEFNPKGGVTVESDGDSYVTVYVPSKSTEFYRYSMCKKMKGKELKRFLDTTQ